MHVQKESGFTCCMVFYYQCVPFTCSEILLLNATRLYLADTVVSLVFCEFNKLVTCVARVARALVTVGAIAHNRNRAYMCTFAFGWEIHIS